MADADNGGGAGGGRLGNEAFREPAEDSAAGDRRIAYASV